MGDVGGTEVVRSFFEKPRLLKGTWSPSELKCAGLTGHGRGLQAILV